MERGRRTGALAQDLRCVSRAEREKGALGIGLPQAGRPVGDQSFRPFRVPTSSPADQPISLRYRGACAPGKEVSGGRKGGRFSGEEAVEKLLYLVLSPLNARPKERRLGGFAEIHTGRDHEARTQWTLSAQPTGSLPARRENTSSGWTGANEGNSGGGSL